MKNVLNILQNDTTLIALLNDGADGIYVSKALRTDRPPYLVVNERLLNPANSSDSGASNGMWEYFVLSFAHNFATVKSVADAVSSALDNVTSQTLDGEWLQWCRLENQDTDHIKEDNIDYYMIEQRFEAFITK